MCTLSQTLLSRNWQGCIQSTKISSAWLDLMLKKLLWLQAKVVVTQSIYFLIFNIFLSCSFSYAFDYNNWLNTVGWQESYTVSHQSYIIQFLPLNFHIQTTKLKSKHVYYFIRIRKYNELLLLSELTGHLKIKIP